MKRWAVGIAVLVLLALAVRHAEGSVVVNVTYTADNLNSAIVVQDGATVTYHQTFFPDGTHPDGNNAVWTLSDTESLTLEYGHTYQLIFRAFNDTSPIWGYTDGNPAGLLAEIVGDVAGPKLTSFAWQYAIDTGQGFGSYPADFNTLTWLSVTPWVYQGTDAYNGGDNNWTKQNGGPIEGISLGAQWIWSPHNGAALGTYLEENFLWIRTQITTPAAIPEPSTLIVWSLLGGIIVLIMMLKEFGS
jgi:hypothetical protein